MFPDLAIAVFLTVCLTIFAIVNLYNLSKYDGSGQQIRYKAEVERPSGLFLVLAGFGTVTFFIESTLYILLVFTGLQPVVARSFLQLRFPYDSWVQLAGIIETAFGYILFIWSVLARGRYATSWAMRENQKLVTWGPYRYVRHPSYLAYFILFTGLFLVHLNLIATIPFIAVPGYVHIATIEEEMLTERFGEAYQEYKRKTGKFFPKGKQPI